MNQRCYLGGLGLSRLDLAAQVPLLAPCVFDAWTDSSRLIIDRKALWNLISGHGRQ
jgi:hypothetical protein